MTRRPNDNHWVFTHYTERMTTKQWREILLSGNDVIMFRGNFCRLKAKNLGAGVVEVSKDGDS